DHELGGDQRVDLPGVVRHVSHRVAHGRQVDDRGNTGEVLVDRAAGREVDLTAGLVRRNPLGDRIDVRIAGGAQDVLEQDAQRVGEALDAVDRADPVDLVRPIPDFQHGIDATQ